MAEPSGLLNQNQQNSLRSAVTGKDEFNLGGMGFNIPSAITSGFTAVMDNPLASNLGSLVNIARGTYDENLASKVVNPNQNIFSSIVRATMNFENQENQPDCPFTKKNAPPPSHHPHPGTSRARTLAPPSTPTNALPADALCRLPSCPLRTADPTPSSVESHWTISPDRTGVSSTATATTKANNSS